MLKRHAQEVMVKTKLKLKVLKITTNEYKLLLKLHTARIYYSS